jgi:hypothetical protein
MVSLNLNLPSPIWLTYPNNQFGFRHNSSTTNAIFKLTNIILSTLNNKMKSGAIFFDLEKVFDCIDHEILLSKSQFYGVKGSMYLLIESYLRNRYQRVKFNNKFSKWGKITKGVPRGSILGPLLFLNYINDLPSFIHFGPQNTSIILFADDTSVLINNYNFRDLENKLTFLLTLMNEWFYSNMLSPNLDKTGCMKFSIKQDYFNKLNIVFRNKNLQELNEVKFLGVTIDNLITWKKHIELITGKLNKACYLIRRSKQFLNIDTLKMIYFAFFHSIISSGLIFWGNTYHSVSIFRLQKRAIRIIVGAGYKDSCRKIFSSLKILPLPSLYIFSVLMFMVNN